MNRWKEHSFKPISRMQVGIHALCALEPARRVARGGDHAPPHLFPLGPAADWRSAAPKRVRHPWRARMPAGIARMLAGPGAVQCLRGSAACFSASRTRRTYQLADGNPPAIGMALKTYEASTALSAMETRPVRYSTPLLALDTQLVRTGQRDQAPGRVCCLPLQR